MTEEVFEEKVEEGIVEKEVEEKRGWRWSSGEEWGSGKRRGGKRGRGGGVEMA